MVRVGMTVKIKSDLVEEYAALHRNVWSDVERKLRELGFRNLSIFHAGNTLFLYQEYHGEVTIEEAYAQYAKDPACRNWEQSMGRFQEEASGALPGVRWVAMEEVYHFAG